MSKARKVAGAPRSRISAKPPVFVPLDQYDIETAYGLIEAFGGIDAVSDEYRTTSETVNAWAVSGNIPTGWSLRMFGKVCGMGKTINPAVFGFRENDEAGQA
jgi:hypothetical protein